MSTNAQKQPPTAANAPSQTAVPEAQGTSQGKPLSTEDIAAFQEAGEPVFVDKTIGSSTNPEALRLIGAVSHEMRNPLNGILGMAHLLEGTALDATQRNYLEGIATSGQVLLRLVNDLLDLTALTNGAVKPLDSPTDIAALVNRCVEMAAARAHEKGLTLGSVVDPALVAHEVLGDGGEKPDLRVILDGQRLEQILTNLLSNAVKFTQHGGIKLTVSVEPRVHHRLVFEVSDTGHGIAEADQAKIFQPFGRTETARQAAIEGTGLGLPLSRGLAEAMGGRLELMDSKPGEGSRMRLSLPHTPVAPSTDATTPGPLQGKSVVLIESPALAQSPEAAALAETLALLGAHVRTVSQIEALEDSLRDSDHVLVDAAFDHAVLWARLNLAPLGIRPVLLLRPQERDQLAHYRAAGFGGYLIRPVRQKSLVAMLTETFGSKDGTFIADPIDNEIKGPPAKSLHVLLAEDDPINARLARAALERAGHRVVPVENGARAIALATGEDASGSVSDYDVVLLDLSMPVIDGFDAAKQIRRLGYTGRLLAYSGNTDPALHDQLRQAGFDGFAQKPLPPDQLVRFISQDDDAATGESHLTA